MKNTPDLKSLLENAVRRRESIAKRNTAYRIINGAGDGLNGVTLDRFGKHFQLQFFGADYLSLKKIIIREIQEQLNPEFLVTKYRLDSSGEALEKPIFEVEIGNPADSSTVVREGECLFHVDLLDTVNPGLFLDMREIRETVAGLSAHKKLLNLFSYTCSFAVHARKNNAEHVTNVDISSKILEKGSKNYALNCLEVLPGEFFRGNSEEYLCWCLKKGLSFDGIILDPPSFSRYKNKVFRVKDNLQNLVSQSANLLSPGGFLMVSSNYSGFTPHSFGTNSLKTVQGVHPKAKIEWCRSQGADFPGSGRVRESCLSAALITVPRQW